MEGSGSTRPKVHVGFDGKGKISVGNREIAPGQQAWIVKFRAPQDPADIGPLEEAYAAMAEAAGLILSEHRLIEAKTGPGYFATRRFDRPDGGKRLHMVSLAGAIEASSEMPSSYDTFLRATLAITRRADECGGGIPAYSVFQHPCHQQSRRSYTTVCLSDGGSMVIGDWHARLCDLTYAPGPNGGHYLDVEGEGRRPTRALVNKLGKRHGLDAKRVANVINKVRAAVADWPKFAKFAGVTVDSAKMASNAHARVWADFR